MQKITLLVVGSLKTAWVKQGCDQYLERININLVEIPASKEKIPVRQQAEECDRILAHLEKMKGEVWALDELGIEMTSPEFSDAISVHRDTGEALIFVLGGAFGLDQRVRTRVDKVFALSKMTYPHELCRIVVLEQIYRAFQIQKGSRYHH